MSADLFVTYFSTLRKSSEVRELGLNETLLIGRAPSTGGLRLYEAEFHISRISVEVELTKEGVRIKNLNSLDTTPVVVKAKDDPSQRLSIGEVRIIPKDCEIVIDSDHRLMCEVKIELNLPEVLGRDAPVTMTREKFSFGDLFPTYRELCAALVVSWFFEDLNGIPPRTVPTTAQLQILLDCETSNAASHRVENARNRINEDLEQDFYGQGSRQEMADWIMLHRYVTRADVEKLPGIDYFLNT